MVVAWRGDPRSRGALRRLLPALAAALVVIAGCGAPAATSGGGDETPAAPTSATLPSAPPNSDVPVETPPQASNGGTSVFDKHADPSLEQALPSEIGGVQLVRFSLSGDDVIASGTEAQYDSLLAKLGKARSDLSIAGATDPTGSMAGSIGALRVRGADPAALLTAYLEVQAARPNPPSTSETVLAGQAVTKLTFAEPGAPWQYVHARGDVLILVTASHDAVATSLLEALP